LEEYASDKDGLMTSAISLSIHNTAAFLDVFLVFCNRSYHDANSDYLGYSSTFFTGDIGCATSRLTEFVLFLCIIVGNSLWKQSL
jgi:hypothetical protein